MTEIFLSKTLAASAAPQLSVTCQECAQTPTLKTGYPFQKNFPLKCEMEINVELIHFQKEGYAFLYV